MNIRLMIFTVGFIIPPLVFGKIVEDSVKIMSGKSHYAWYFPNYIPVQYAGNIGLISAGIGYTARKQNYQLSLLYGYVPASLAGVNVHTITAKNIFPVYKLQVNNQNTIIPYLACGVSLEVNGRSFFSLPANMPEGYYRYPKSLHFIPSAGVKLHSTNRQFGFVRSLEFFAEVSTVDVYLWSRFISNEVRTYEIMSLALGIHLTTK
jgi:hypothetical protein